MDNNRIIPVNLVEEMRKSFIAYSMAVIIDRALPDVRDGLKPVHRRILYAMDELSMHPDKPFRKSARLVGDVLGKYHPHGDSAVYDAMVRLAQPFASRYMLVEGHGNFGSIDGDGAAAMRYTEARMSKLASLMMRDIDKNTVDFYPNFDETLMQPTVMPSRFPNLLVNGTGGIAVGMATNIPPHNLGEVIDALCAMIDNPEIGVDELMGYIPGPDFPTGGMVLGTSGIRQAYRTGRGRIVTRAKAEIEQYKPNHARIIVTEIPYQVNKARLVESIAKLVHDKKVEGISDLRDETDRSGIRIVIELKRDVNANVILNQLYKHTQLMDTFGVIMLALVNNEPKILNLRDMLYHYLKFQKEVVTRRTKYDLDKALERLHLLEGLIKALDHIDEIVELIKTSQTPQIAKQRLMDTFDFSERQAQAILDMRLQRLTGLERDKLMNEFNELTAKVAYLKSVLSDEGLLLSIVREEALEVKEKFADERRTQITALEDEIDLEDVIQQEDMLVSLTHFGYIKRVASDTYRAQRRGGKGVTAQTTRDEDFVERIFSTSTHSEIMYFTNTGRAFKLKCYRIPEASRTAKGTAVVNLLQLKEGEKISAIFPLPENTEGKYLVIATKCGVIKKTAISEFDNINKSGIIAQSLREGDELISVMLTDGSEDIIVATKKGIMIRFGEDDVRPMGRSATGVRAIMLDDDDEVVDAQAVISGSYVTFISENGIGKRTEESQFKTQRRGGRGMIAMTITDKTGYLRSMRLTKGDEDLMIIRDDGTAIRMPVDGISIVGRYAQGVRLMRMDEGSKVKSVALLERTEEVEEEDIK
ncbi:MAG: DNA gyrase subunit A [Clostridia bacterium]|nr:DNA gyrase subunit A [Clostridia bacterium]